VHPGGGCGFARHGTYARLDPPGMRVARWRCPTARMTFSLLPDCLASRLCGSLDEAEQAVVLSESVGVEPAARVLRVDEVGLTGALRWLRRRRQGLRAALVALMTAMPGRFGTVPEVRALRAVLGSERALLALREIGTDHLHALPPPLGLRPTCTARAVGEAGPQHETGPDPPSP
jgi:transposase-like protein